MVTSSIFFSVKSLNLQLVQDEDANKIVTLKQRHLVFGGMPKSITGSAIPSVDEYRDADWPDAARLLSTSQNAQVKLATGSAARLRASDLP